MTMRLSIISFAGMVRTLVAVGTERLCSMLTARVFAIPRRGETLSSSSGLPSDLVAAGASAGIGCGFAWIEVVFAIGWVPVDGGPAGTAAGVAESLLGTSSGIWASADASPASGVATPPVAVWW